MRGEPWEVSASEVGRTGFALEALRGDVLAALSVGDELDPELTSAIWRTLSCIVM